MKQEIVHDEVLSAVEEAKVHCPFDRTVVSEQSDAPQILVRPRSQNVNEGQRVKFTCELVGDPSPKVEWLKDNMTVSSLLKVICGLFIG